MEMMFERVAGLDIGEASLTVCVRTPGARRGRQSETRTFKTTTGSLRVMRDWLVEKQVTIAAMESTLAYRKAPFYCLEEVMEVWLLNAAHMKAAPGRKTDVRDAEWIAQLLEQPRDRSSLTVAPDRGFQMPIGSTRHSHGFFTWVRQHGEVKEVEKETAMRFAPGGRSTWQSVR